MPYVLPTATELKATFPAFAAVADATVDIWIGRAARSVDISWPEDDYQYAIELLACHYMVGLGYGTGAAAEMNSKGMGSFALIRSGQLTLQRNTSSQNETAPAPWGGDWYGVQFYWLMRRAKPAVAVAQGTMEWPNEYWRP